MSPASSAIRRCSISLREKIIPDLVRSHSSDNPIRVWIAGCSTGEETYSLAMLFLRGRSRRRSATSSCRSSPPMSTRMPWRPPEMACYPETIEADVSPARLARFS